MGGKKKNAGGKKKSEAPRIVEDVEDVDDSEDEEIDEDEAFNSDDDRKYGAFFAEKDNNGSDEELDSDDEDDDDDEENDSQGLQDEDSQEGDGGQYMLDLLDRLDDKTDAPKEDKNRGGRLETYVKESPFAASVLPAANLTLDSLMDGLKDTKGFGAVAKSLKQVATGKATSAPLAKVKADRVERKLHYEKQSEEVSNWVDAVQENRRAETLDFRPKERIEATRDVMIDSFVPSTDFELQLQAALEQAGQKDEKAILEAEEKAITDDLGNNVITMEEYENRRGQLAKMRSLMLSYEQKRHHINKIKSKKYRRIRKRQREKAKEAELADAAEENPDLARELEEKEEIDRMKERMTLAHKNTSKWAKRVLKRGKNVDIGTRRALSAQLKKGDDLLKRMQSRTQGQDDDDSDEDLVESARKVLEDTDKEEAPASGLFKLAFMQRGVDKQKQRAKAEARKLLEELEEEGLEDDSSDDDDDEPEEAAPKREKVASAREMKGVLKEGNMVASSLTFGNSTSLAVSGHVSLDADSHPRTTTETRIREHSALIGTDESQTKHAPTQKGDSKKASSTDKAENQPSQGAEGVQLPSTDGSAKKRKKNKKAAEKEPTEEEAEDNPWLAAAEASSSTTKNKKKRQETGLVDVERAAEILDTSARQVNHKSPSKASEDTKDDEPKEIVELTQDELVRRAFAGINDQEDFDEEKKRVQEEEEGVLKKKKQKPDPSEVSGWGSWTGLGAPPPPPKRKLPKHLEAPKTKKQKRERKDKGKPKVILREGRLKLANTYMLQHVPHPYKSREEYEQSMMGGIGREWNMSFKEMTRPDVVTRAGKIIKPVSMQAKRKVARPAAKF